MKEYPAANVIQFKRQYLHYPRSFNLRIAIPNKAAAAYTSIVSRPHDLAAN